MKIITSDLPKYTVVFNHPDDSSKVREFFVDLENENEPWSDEECALYKKALIKEVWEEFNHYGYYHTMTITAEYYFDGKKHIVTICDEATWADIDESAEYHEIAEDYEITEADLHDYMYGI